MRKTVLELKEQKKNHATAGCEEGLKRMDRPKVKGIANLHNTFNDAKPQKICESTVSTAPQSNESRMICL